MMREPPGWYVFTLPDRHRRRTLTALRALGIDVVRLMYFAEVRAHRTTRRRRADQRKPLPALGTYVFIRIERGEQWDLVAAWGEGLQRLRLDAGLAPRLPAAGAAWIEAPPRELFYDTRVPALRAGPASDDAGLVAGDWVSVYSHGFDGLKGEIVSLRSGRAKVRFVESLFEIEVDTGAAVKVDAPPEARPARKAAKRAA